MSQHSSTFLSTKKLPGQVNRQKCTFFRRWRRSGRLDQKVSCCVHWQEKFLLLPLAQISNSSSSLRYFYFFLPDDAGRSLLAWIDDCWKANGKKGPLCRCLTMKNRPLLFLRFFSGASSIYWPSVRGPMAVRGRSHPRSREPTCCSELLPSCAKHGDFTLTANC